MLHNHLIQLMKHIACILMLLVCHRVFAQKRDIPIRISFFNEATAIPFTKLFPLPVHPGFQAATEFNYKVKTHGRLFQTAAINYFYHKHLNHGAALYTEFGYEYRLNFGLAFSALLGAGYLHTFTDTEEYTFVNGQYEKKEDRGNSRLYPSLSFDIGYYLKKDKPNSSMIFLRYQSWLEYPYSPGFIPAMSHINIHLGTTFFLPSKQSTYEKR